jgi:uncharacterized protein
MAIYQKCIPHAYHASIFEIPYKKLKEQGIKSLFFDLDNTIIAYDDEILTQKHIDLLNDLKKDFQIVVISNTNYKRVKKALTHLDVPYIWYAKKPLKFGFKKAMRMVDSTKDETIVIGDQLMTDIFGGSRFGIKSILIRSVKRKSDRWITQFNRKIEKIILKKLKRSVQLYMKKG